MRFFRGLVLVLGFANLALAAIPPYNWTCFINLGIGMYCLWTVTLPTE